MSRSTDFGDGVIVGMLSVVLLAVFLWAMSLLYIGPDANNRPAPSPQPRETPRVWELPSGEGVCVLLGDIPIGCYQKGTAP